MSASCGWNEDCDSRVHSVEILGHLGNRLATCSARLLDYPPQLQRGIFLTRLVCNIVPVSAHPCHLVNGHSSAVKVNVVEVCSFFHPKLVELSLIFECRL
jgi:hypothetical protein